MAQDLWASSRLIYRGCDGESDDDFVATLGTDPESLLNSAPLLPIPRSKATAKSLREHLTGDKILMCAIICLLPEATPTDASPKDEAKAESDKDKSADDKDKPKPTPIGFVCLSAEDSKFQHHRHSEIGIQILRPYQGKGYGTEALEWVMGWGFRRAQLHRLGIGAFSWNVGAIRLYERMGFVKEACKRDFFWHDGEYHDLIELGMLEGEWRARYGKKK